MVPAWPLVVARLVLFASLLVLFGASLFFLYGLDPTAHGAVCRDTWPRRLLPASAVVGLLASIGWLVAETASLMGQPLLRIDWASLQAVATQTRFGQITLARFGLLAAALVLTRFLSVSRTLWATLAVLGGAAAASFAWTGHGSLGAGAGRLVHLTGDVVHLWAAGIWLGALVALGILLYGSSANQAPPDLRSAAYSLERFSGIGSAVVAVLLLSGLVNTGYVIGSSRWQEIFTTVYGRLLSLKLALFAAMLLLAAVNRYRLSPRLRSALEKSTPTAGALQVLRRTVMLETCLGLAVLAAVALFGVLEPPISESP